MGVKGGRVLVGVGVIVRVGVGVGVTPNRMKVIPSCTSNHPWVAVQ